jgi:dihydroxyacetone kinase
VDSVADETLPDDTHAVNKARAAGLQESYRVTTDAATQAHSAGADVALCRMPGVTHVLMPPG